MMVEVSPVAVMLKPVAVNGVPLNVPVMPPPVRE